MNTPDYTNEASWRGQMLAGQMGVRQSISELGFLIAGLFLAYLLSEYWPGLAIVVAAAMCGGAIYRRLARGAGWRRSSAETLMQETETDRAAGLTAGPSRPLTTCILTCAARGRALICPRAPLPSSSGLGRRPLTAETGVRVP